MVRGPHAATLLRGVSLSSSSLDAGILHIDLTIPAFASCVQIFSEQDKSLMAQEIYNCLVESVLLAKYPKGAISLHCTVLRADGSELSACIMGKRKTQTVYFLLYSTMHHPISSCALLCIS